MNSKTTFGIIALIGAATASCQPDRGYVPAPMYYIEDWRGLVDAQYKYISQCSETDEVEFDRGVDLLRDVLEKMNIDGLIDQYMKDLWNAMDLDHNGKLSHWEVRQYNRSSYEPFDTKG